MIDRRLFLLTGAAFAWGCRAQTLSTSSVPHPDFAALQARLGPGGRLGVAALDTGSGRRLGHDEGSRYAMASTFKWALAAAILAEADRGALSLDQDIPFGPSDIISHSPVTEAHLAAGRLPIGRMCQAIVEVSDNAAANLLLARIGGPAELTAFIRRSGDPVTRLDRTELELNSNLPGDPRDTTTPAAMVALLRTLLLGEALSVESRARLTGWLESSATGRERLRAGLPAGWRAGDKTGSGANGAVNDVAIAWPPGRTPILIACYQSGGHAEGAERNAVHAEVARLVAAAFA